MKKKLTYIFILIFAVLISFSVAREKAWAGDINGDEARVIAAASGTFTYNGKTYRAYSSYISQLYSYLAADDVDLSASQADKAISYIYSNVQSGVSSGYVYEVGATDGTDGTGNTDANGNSDGSNGNDSTGSGNTVNLDDWSPEDGVGTGDSDGSDTGDKNSNGKSNKDNDATKAAKELSDKEVEDMFQDIESEESARRKHSQKPKATETDASIIMTEDKIVISNGDSEYTLEADKSIVPSIVPTILIIIGIVIVAINVLVAAVLFAKKCIRLKSGDSKRPRKGHTARRRIRKVCRNTLTVTTAIAVVMTFAVIAVAISLYNNNRIVQNIQSSGYFRYAYTKYLSDVAVSDSEILGYEDFLVEEKKALIDMQASDMTKDCSIAPYIRGLQKDLSLSLMVAGILSGVAILISAFLNIFMDLRRDRGVRSIATSELIGTAVTILLAAVIYILHSGGKIFIEPDYLYSFINDYIDWIIKIIIIIGFFGGVIGMSLTGLYINMRREKG
ncbi:hypothetical protein SAMN02910369_01422 [Lachnospiraceae bacterium NE2001]|nr:hypothetical protein SAMN02910369_01422 [Lachnospiraceae bacterium NE2001]